MKKLGVIGGLGPMATAYFLQLVIQMSDAKTDQEHIETIIHSRPQIPDRTRYILGLSRDNPMPLMAQVGKGLVRQGAEMIAIPCITAHFFQKQLEKEIGVPIVNAIEETALYLEAAGIDKAGILATDGTIQSGLFQKALEKHEIRCILPDEKGQKQVMHLIYEDIKSGNPIELSLFEEVSGQLFREGAQAVLLACTELSLIKRDYGVGAGFLDVMEVLARKSVLSCGRLKKEYEQLVTK
ncbi:MAG: amino acid racemase [Lachnoclostridium sp.]|nr:amino acid racemase [Lachnospira sp.]MCM1248198.1 amino acid racemase [Lachnoclostridium sp.]MCM1534481.1 amino acid racemase [Clostridium sp.]